MDEDVRILWLFNLHAIAGKNDSFRGNGTTREEKSASHREDDLKHARVYIIYTYTYTSFERSRNVGEGNGKRRRRQT